MEGNKNGDEHRQQVQAVWFAAGTAALMAGMERAVVVAYYSFIQQWRVWVFLALNLLLLAILLTSSTYHHQELGRIDSKKKRILKKQSGGMRSTAGDIDEEEAVRSSEPEAQPLKMSQSRRADEEIEIVVKKQEEKADMKEEEEEEEDKEMCAIDDQISNEELNARVEAFIAMFRRHLVSDAKGKSNFCRINAATVEVR